MPSSAYTRNRGRISLALSGFTLSLFTRTYHAFEGDFVAVIVLGAIAHRNLERWLNDDTHDESALYAPEEARRAMRPCNALSIAEACGLPRETVRRKVIKLIDRGWVERDARGMLYIRPGLGDDFDALTLETIESVRATARRIDTLLGDA